MRSPRNRRARPFERLLLFLFLTFGDVLHAGSVTERLELVRQSLTGVHCRYRIVVDGIETDDYLTRPCQEPISVSAEMREGPLLRRTGGRIVRRAVVGERPEERVLEDVDVATGEVVRRVPFFFHSKTAQVFDPNPVVTLNAPALQDGNDAAGAVPPSAYRIVELTRAAEAGPLRGPHAVITELQAPAVPPADAAGPLVFDREAPGFEDVNAFFHIDRSQEHLRSLGFEGERAVAPYAIEVDTHSLSGSDNSVFAPSLTKIGTGQLHFGEGGTDDAEDADLVVHEYAHALLEWISPGTFGGAYNAQPRALAEGIADYWAWSAHRAARAASGRDLYCFADWDARCWTDDPSQQCRYPAGSDCLRRVDGTRTMAGYLTNDAPGVEHINGSIWSSALREIQETIAASATAEAARRITDSIVLESLFGLPPRPTFAAAARRLLQADRLLFGGAHQGAICAAMASRQVLTACDASLRGELRVFQTGRHRLEIPDGSRTGVTAELTISDPRAIRAIGVRVDIEHPLRGDLQIELIAPDGATFVLQQVSLDRSADIHATYGVDAEPVQTLAPLLGRSAAGTWGLRVLDLRARDRGVLVSWGLLLELEGDEPFATRPSSERRQMIPVAAHVRGALDTTFRTDLRVANPSSGPREATLVFTPSGADGTTAFSAVRVPLAAGQTVALDDVVRSVFQTTGSGSLEVLGDVVAMSRTYHSVTEGTLGQQVPPVEETTGVAGPELVVAGIGDPSLRNNLGITETAGQWGVVRVSTELGMTDLEIAPYSHRQWAVGSTTHWITVEQGGARVAGYLSQVSGNGDALFVPAQAPRDRSGIAPAGSLAGPDGTFWSSDLWVAWAVKFTDVQYAMDIYYQTGDEIVWLEPDDDLEVDVIGRALGRPGTAGVLVGLLPSELAVFTRVVGAGTSQYVPFLDPKGPPVQHLVFVENDARYRTNIGIVADEAAIAEVRVYDAAGTLLELKTISVAAKVAQAPVTATVTAGRAEVRFLAGRGRAYASLIDRGTRDGTLVVGR